MKRETGKNFRILILIVLIVGTVFYSFVYGIKTGMDETVPHPISRHNACIASAISELKYNLRGYRAYTKVLVELVNNGMTTDKEILNKYGREPEEILRDSDMMNNAIKKAININNVSSAGEYYLTRDDKGAVKYYKLAFMLFGYRVESFFYIYFLLLSLSVIFFIVTFHRHIDLLCVFLLFILSHHTVMAAASKTGIQLATVHNTRFLPVLGLLPGFYIALLTLGKKANNKIAVLGTLVQAFILIFIIHVRTSGIYMILFLCLLYISALFLSWARRLKDGVYILKKPRLWPLVIVIVGFLILKMHLMLSLNFPYVGPDSRHVIWHTTYMGLAAHPESMSKYGIEYNDSVPLRVIHKRLTEYYGNTLSSNSNMHNIVERKASLSTKLREDIIKKEFIKILKNDTGFVVINYIYKLPLFIRRYFSHSFGAINYLSMRNMFSGILLVSLLGAKVFFRRWRHYFFLVTSELVFSLIPIIISMPEPYLIADSAMMFTLFLSMIFSWMFMFLFNRIGNYSEG